MLLCKLVKLLKRNVEQSCHLVDKRARAACAGAVHAHLKAARKKQYFCVLAAQLDYYVCSGDKRISGYACCVNLLNEFDSAVLGNAHARRTRQCNRRVFYAVNLRTNS